MKTVTEVCFIADVGRVIRKYTNEHWFVTLIAKIPEGDHIIYVVTFTKGI